MNYSNQLLKNLKINKVYSSLKYNVWNVNLAYMQLLNKYNKGVRCLFYVIDTYGKYAWVVPLKEQKEYNNY